MLYFFKIKTLILVIELAQFPVTTLGGQRDVSFLLLIQRVVVGSEQELTITTSIKCVSEVILTSADVVRP